MSILTADLRTLVAKWIDFMLCDNACVLCIERRTVARECADELHALIVKSEAEPQVSDSEQRIAAVLKISRNQMEWPAWVTQRDDFHLVSTFWNCGRATALDEVAAALGASPAPPKEGE